MIRKDRYDQSKSTKTDNFEERVLQIKRVSKKNVGGNTIGFSALAVVGTKLGKVGMGYGKAKDVAQSIAKALSLARKSMIEVKMKGDTIPHDVSSKLGASSVFLKPAPKGSGLIASSTVRAVVELAGVKDISTKMHGSGNKVTDVKCTLNALKKLRSRS